jgi:hypothetical protein
MFIPLRARSALAIIVVATAVLLSRALHSVPVEEPWPELMTSQPLHPEFVVLHERAKLALAALGHPAEPSP